MKQVRKSIDLLKKNKKLIALSSFIDLAFFFIGSLLLTKTTLVIKEHIEAVYNLLKGPMGASSEITPELMTSLLDRQDLFLAHYSEIAKYVGLLVLGVFISWIVLQGTVWYLAQVISKNRPKPSVFARRFVLVSAIGLGLILSVFFLSVYVTLQQTATVIALYSTETINTITTIVFLVVFYLVFVALGVLEEHAWHKRFLETACARPLIAVPLFLAIGGVIVGLNYLMMRSLQVHWVLFAVFTLFIVLPSYSVGRVVWIRALSSSK